MDEEQKMWSIFLKKRGYKVTYSQDNCLLFVNEAFMLDHEVAEMCWKIKQLENAYKKDNKTKKKPIRCGVIIRHSNGNESMITEVNYQSNNFYAGDSWHPFSYIGNMFTIVEKG